MYRDMYRPITLVDKTLRNGAHLELSYDHDGMSATIDGHMVAEGFNARVHRHAVDLARTPHVIELPASEALPAPPGHKGVPVGLTTAEADAVDRRGDDYLAAPGRRARAAVPDARTWTTSYTPHGWPPPGRVLSRPDEGRWVMILAHRRTWTEDGRSFGLGRERGYLHAAVVREATAEEIERGHA